MNIIFGSNANVGMDLKPGFVADYGKYSASYGHLDSLGNQKFNTQWPYIVIIVGIILSIVTFIAATPEKDAKTGLPKERTSMQQIYLGLTWLFILCTIFGSGYGLYLYFAIYLPEYYKWFDSLPADAKGRLGMILTIDKIKENEISERNRLLSSNYK